jgi:hypothetical protein
MTSVGRLTMTALSGVIWGVGLAVLLQQFGLVPLGPLSLYGIPVVAALLSLLWTRSRGRAAVAGSLTIIAVAGVMSVAALQESGCAAVISADDGNHRDLSDTEIGDPFVVGEDDESIEISVTGPDSGNEARAWVEIGGTKITPKTWSEGFSGGDATFRVQRSESPIGNVPGIFHVGAEIVGECSIDGYVKIAGNPLTNPIGQGAISAMFLGLIGTWWAGRPRGVSSPHAEEPSQDLEPEPSVETPQQTVPGIRTPFVSIEIVDPSTGLRISAMTPLVAGTSYDMVVRVSPEDQGAEGRALPLTVLATSDNIEVDGVTPAMMHSGGGAIATIPITPRTTDDDATIDFDLLYRGNLLQSQRVSSHVTATEVQSPGAMAVRSEDTTFTASSFDRSELEALPERHVTLILRHDESDGSVDCEIILAGSGSAITRCDTVNPKEELLSASARVRERLRAMVEDDASGYRTVLRANSDRLDRWLPALADIGHSLYLTLLDPEGVEGSDLGDVAQFGSVIQVNQVGSGLGKATVPWALLYEPEIDYRPGATSVCSDYTTHGPEECPHGDDPTIVCPWGFWGYRYVLEQPPGWRGDRDDLPGVMIREVENERPLQLSAAANTTLQLWQSHFDALPQIGDVDVHAVTSTDGLVELWERLGDRVDLAYFYVHAGAGQTRAEPYLSLADAAIGRNNLRAWRTRLDLSWTHGPLVILNGCGTGDYGPDAYSSLINEFRSYGAAGVVGTECVVSEAIAGAYICEVLGRFASGESLGPIMLDVRRRFLLEWNNPSALLYTLYAPSDIQLAVPVAEPAIREDGPT